MRVFLLGWLMLTGCLYVDQHGESDPMSVPRTESDCCHAHYPSQDEYVQCVAALLEPDQCIQVQCLTIEGEVCYGDDGDE